MALELHAPSPPTAAHKLLYVHIVTYICVLSYCVHVAPSNKMELSLSPATFLLLVLSLNLQGVWSTKWLLVSKLHASQGRTQGRGIVCVHSLS